MSYLNPLEVWFVNVGHGDSTIVRFPSGRIMMLDINNCKVLDTETQGELLEAIGVGVMEKMLFSQGAYSLSFNEAARMKKYEDLLEDPVAVLKNRVFMADEGEIFRFVTSHPDLDHISGLYRLHYQEPNISIPHFWDTANSKSISSFKNRDDELNWLAYQDMRGSSVPPQTLHKYRGDTGEYWSHDNTTVLSPTPEIVLDANSREDWNHLSYVFHISHGSSSIILPGDASIAAQKEIVESYGANLASVVLKAPHHGRDSGFCKEFASLVSPDYTIVSVGKKPSTDASNKYRQHTRHRVLSTRFQGTMHLKMHYDGSLELYNHKFERLDLHQDVSTQKAGR